MKHPRTIHRAVSVLLASLLLVGLTACANAGTGEDAPPSDTTEKAVVFKAYASIPSEDCSKYAITMTDEGPRPVLYETITDNDAEKRTEITPPLTDQPLTLSYTWTENAERYLHPVRLYQDNSKNTVGIDRETGKVVYYRANKTTITTNTGEALSADALRGKAEAAFDQLVTLYEIHGSYSPCDVHDGTAELLHYYTFEFVRKIGGLPTAERISIMITEDGRVCGYSVEMPNAFSQLTLPADAAASVDAAVAARLDELKQKAGADLVFGSSTTVSAPYVTVTADGKTAIRTDVTLEVRKADETAFGSIPVTLLIPLG